MHAWPLRRHAQGACGSATTKRPVLPTVDRERTIKSRLHDLLLHRGCWADAWVGDAAYCSTTGAVEHAVYGAHRHTCEREAVPLVLATALALDTQSLINITG